MPTVPTPMPMVLTVMVATPMLPPTTLASVSPRLMLMLLCCTLVPMGTPMPMALTPTATVPTPTATVPTVSVATPTGDKFFLPSKVLLECGVACHTASRASSGLVDLATVTLIVSVLLYVPSDHHCRKPREPNVFFQ